MNGEDGRMDIPHPWTFHMWRWRNYLNEVYGFTLGDGPEDCMWCVDATRSKPDTYAAFCAVERMTHKSRPHGVD